jgi:hypothetical protein
MRSAGVAPVARPLYRGRVSAVAFFTLCFPSLFSIVDPIACVPVYLALVDHEPRATAAQFVIDGWREAMSQTVGG